jgi:uncharacterized protein with LGFP repeats
MKVTRVLGLAAVGALLILAAPTERAQALSLANPGAAAAVQEKFKAGNDRSALESSLAPPSSLLALPLIGVG